jgi:hypothetical protein
MKQEEGLDAWKHGWARLVIGRPRGEGEDTAIRMFNNQLDQVLDPAHLPYGQGTPMERMNGIDNGDTFRRLGVFVCSVCIPS